MIPSHILRLPTPILTHTNEISSIKSSLSPPKVNLSVIIKSAMKLQKSQTVSSSTGFIELGVNKLGNWKDFNVSFKYSGSFRVRKYSVIPVFNKL